MDMSKPRDRIWYNMLDLNRMARYYSRRSGQLEKLYKGVALVVALIPLVVLGMYQLKWVHATLVGPIVLFAVGLAEFAIIHYDFGGNVKSAKIKSNQSSELAGQWRDLWIEQDRPNRDKWMESLERQKNALMTESIPFSKRLNDKCAKEVKIELPKQFGGA